MGNRAYYGEYSLKHWLQLMLNREIELPSYQRYFVWTKEQIEGLIKTFKENRFVPPVTIGHIEDSDGDQNLIIDGQQRLTSILLSRLGVMPNSAWKSNDALLANRTTEDPSIEEDVEEDGESLKKWKYENLLKSGRCTIEDIERALVSKQDKYLKINAVDDEFLSSHYLGFSYLVPEAKPAENQQGYYARHFRELNICGSSLSPLESRQSLYFLKKGFEEKFNPPFAKNAKLKSKSKFDVPEQMDFIRYAALLAEYNERGGSSHRVAYGFMNKLEKYFERFICAVVETEQSAIFGDSIKVFRDFINSDKWQTFLDFVNWSQYAKEYVSIIDMDVMFFGLTYWLIYQGRQVDRNKIARLTGDLEIAISNFKQDSSHKRAPGALKYLRARMDVSVRIYGGYLLP